MSFSSDMKNEMCRLPMGKPCCMLSELSSLTRTLGSLSFQGLGRVRVTYRMLNVAVARRIFLLLRARLNLTAKLHFVTNTRFGGRRTCVLTLEDEQAKTLLLALHMMEVNEDGIAVLKRTTPRHPMTRQCCRGAFLRGSYLGTGAMTAPEKGYHLEFAAEEDLARQIVRVLEKAGITGHTHLRRDREVVTVKEGQSIADLLVLMGAHHALLDLENIRITRSSRLAATRMQNCDEHNGEKMLASSEKQLEDIRRLADAGKLEGLPPALKEAAEMRLEHPELGLADLGALMEPPVGKSGMNHRMRRLAALAAENGKSG